VEANANNGRVNLGYFTGLTSGTVMLQKAAAAPSSHRRSYE